MSRPTAFPFRHGGPVAAEFRVHRPVAEDRRILVRRDRHGLLVGPIIQRPGLGAQARAVGEVPGLRGDVVLAASEGPSAALDVPAGWALFEAGRRFVEAACGQTSRESLKATSSLRSLKIGALALRILELQDMTPRPDVVITVLWIALVRTVGHEVGAMALRPTDAWMNPGALQRVVELVDAELAGELPSARLAAPAGLGPSAFLRAFSGSTGMTPREYVLKRRAAVASELLAETDLPIVAVAERVGFGSGTHFATTFLSLLGVSPSTYRREMRLGGQLRHR